MPFDRRETLARDALLILADPLLAPLFGPGSQAEVSVAAQVSVPGRAPVAVTGQIDRIGVTPTSVFIADYKTGAPRDAAATPPSYVTQLALYRAAVQPLYPDRTVRAFLVWTAGPAVVELDPAALDAALAGVAG